MDNGPYIKMLKERLRQAPDSKLVLSLAEEFRKKDLLENAIAVLVEGIRKNPDFNAARLTLGRWYLASDMLPEAKKVLSEVIEKDAGNISAHKGLAEVYARMGNPDAAAEEYGFVLESNPFDIAAMSFLKSAGYPGRRQETTVTLPPGPDNERVMERLNVFLETVKKRFATGQDEGLRMDGNNSRIERLNSFLEAIRQRFGGESSGVSLQSVTIERLDSFLHAIKRRFSERHDVRDQGDKVRRLKSLMKAINNAFGADGKNYKLADTGH